MNEKQPQAKDGITDGERPQVQDLPVFVLDTEPTVEWPVVVAVPVDGGELAQMRFNARLRVLSETEHEAILKDEPTQGLLAAGEASEAAQAQISLAARDAWNAKTLPRLVASWDLADAAHRPVPVERLPELLQGPLGGAIAQGLWAACAQVRFGVAAKNALPLRAIGR